MTTKVTMPQLGESVVEGTVGKWLVSEGDSVEKDQPLVEILTDKADSELPAPVAGVITKLLADVDDIVAVGDPICEIDENGAGASTSASGGEAGVRGPTDTEGPSSEEEVEQEDEESESTAGAAKTAKERAEQAGGKAQTAGRQRVEGAAAEASPSVRKLARELDVDIDALGGSGEGGRITHEDVQKAASSQSEQPGTPEPQRPGQPPRVDPGPSRPQMVGEPAPSQPKARRQQQPAGFEVPSGAFRVPPYKPSENDEVVPFSRRRRIIADHMVYSKHVSPEVVTFAECDLYETARLRSANKAKYAKEGVSLTYLGFVVAATARALREFPELNARVLDDAYVKLGDVNLGIAVDTPKGLVVPVIKHADDLTIRGLARAITDIAERSRDGNLTPDDLAGKTFSISNPGRKGNLVGGAIISQPNVGILRIGTIKKRPVVVEKDGQDLIAIHPVMYMALTYDHRVVDGVNANGFLYRISEILEQGDFEL